MASNKCKHDIRVTEFIKGKQAGIDLTQRTDYFTKDMSKLTRFNANSLDLDNEGNSCEGDYCVITPIVYFLYITLLDCIPVLVYVGQTINGYKRINDHKEKGRPFDHWRYISAPHRMLDDIEEYYIRTYKPVLNLVKNPLYMWDNGKYRISKENSGGYFDELERHILQILDSLEQKQVPPDLIIRDGTNISFNLIPKELERKYFDL